MRTDLQRLKRDTDSGRMALLRVREHGGGRTGKRLRVAAQTPSPASGSSPALAPAQRHRAPHLWANRLRLRHRNVPTERSPQLLAAAALVLAVLYWFVKQRSATGTAATATSEELVAVLPLQNLGSDKDVDFLRLALADEIATALSYVRSLSIRPFATTSKYDSPTLDLQEAGRPCR